MPPRPRPISGVSARGAVRRRKVDGQRREAVLLELENLLLREGFGTLTVDGMAARLQCSKSTLYAIASSKEQLVAAAIRNFFREATERIGIKIAGIDDPPERIAVYLAAIGAEMSRMSAACYADMTATDVTWEIYRVNSRAAAERVRHFVDEGVKVGSFRQVHADFVSEVVGLVIDSIQHGELLSRTGLTSGDAYGELSALVLGALEHRPRQDAG
jgi:AcrR family transcriptional regulator